MNLETLVVDFGLARLAVRNARTRDQFLKASADLWEAERALEQQAAILAGPSDVVPHIDVPYVNLRRLNKAGAK